MPPALDIDRTAVTNPCLRHGIRRLALFGSALRSDFAPTSDVDLLVEFSPGCTPGFFRLHEIEQAFSPLFGGRRIDLRTREDLSPYFRDQVLHEAQPLYDAA